MKRHIFFDIGGTILRLGDHPRPFDEAQQVLSMLRECGHVLACISNVSRDADSRHVYPYLFANFQACFMSHETGFRKPSPAAFLCAQNYFAATPDQCLMVGDSMEVDILPALELGWVGVLVAPHVEIQSNYKCVQHLHVVPRIVDLLQLVN